MALAFPDPVLPDDQAVDAFVDALNSYLLERFTCRHAPAERTMPPGLCISVDDEQLSLYLRFKSGLYDCAYDRPLAISGMRFTEEDQDHDLALLHFVAANAAEHDIGTIILEHGAGGEDGRFLAMGLLFKPCGFYAGNWHVPAQDLLWVMEYAAA